jgi:hypothetical protein
MWVVAKRPGSYTPILVSPYIYADDEQQVTFLVTVGTVTVTDQYFFAATSISGQFLALKIDGYGCLIYVINFH